MPRNARAHAKIRHHQQQQIHQHQQPTTIIIPIPLPMPLVCHMRMTRLSNPAPPLSRPPPLPPLPFRSILLQFLCRRRHPVRHPPPHYRRIHSHSNPRMRPSGMRIHSSYTLHRCRYAHTHIAAFGVARRRSHYTTSSWSSSILTRALPM